MESYQRGLSQSFYQFTGSGKPPLAQKDVLNPEVKEGLLNGGKSKVTA